MLPLVEELRGDPEAATLCPANHFFAGCLQLIRARALQARLAEIAREMNVAGPEQQLLLYREKKLLTDQLRGETGYLRKGGLKSAIRGLTPQDAEESRETRGLALRLSSSSASRREAPPHFRTRTAPIILSRLRFRPDPR